MPHSPPIHDLLAPAFLARLDRLDILSRQILAGKLRGEHAGPRRAAGASIEWADFRDYTPGDDPRFIDWNIHARLDRLLIKLFVHEEELSLDILLDTSKSCDFGRPSKAIYLKQLAAAFAYVGLANQHHVTIWPISAGHARASGPLTSRSSAGRMMRFLTTLESAGPIRFGESCRQFAAARRHRGICVVLSDFLFQDGADVGLKHLAAVGHDLLCIQVLSPREIDPPLAGNVRLTDIETGASRQLHITPALLQGYHANLQAARASIARAVSRHGGTYLFTPTDAPVDRLVLDRLRRVRRVG